VEDKIKVRTNFLGPILLLFGGFIAIAGYYSIGLSVPLLLLGGYCLVTKEREFLGLASLATYRVIYIALMVLAAIVWHFIGTQYAMSFLLGGILFACSEPLFQKLLSILGLLGLAQ